MFRNENPGGGMSKNGKGEEKEVGMLRPSTGTSEAPWQPAPGFFIVLLSARVDLSGAVSNSPGIAQ